MLNFTRDWKKWTSLKGGYLEENAFQAAGTKQDGTVILQTE